MLKRNGCYCSATANQTRELGNAGCRYFYPNIYFLCCKGEKRHLGCEIQDLAETHLCKLRVILESRVLVYVFFGSTPRLLRVPTGSRRSAEDAEFIEFLLCAENCGPRAFWNRVYK